MPRTKSKAPSAGNAAALITRSQAEQIAAGIVRAQIDRETLVADRDAAVLAAQEQHQPEIDQLSAAIDQDMSMLESWAAAHPDEFGAKRSITLSGHRVGWRTGQPRAKGKRGWTWAKILAVLRESSEELRSRYLRTREEVSKEALIAARETHPLDLEYLHVQIEQSETFFLEPAREGQDPTTLTR
jgi:phage host-nuclease inhibitor protein Gam